MTWVTAAAACGKVSGYLTVFESDHCGYD